MNRHRRWARFSLVLTLTLSVQPATSASDPCGVFTTEQIATALGKKVMAGRVPPQAPEGCQWDAADGRGTVMIQPFPAGLWFDLSGRTGQRPVPGVGEKAYIGPSPLGGVQAGAVAGEVFYLVRMNPAPADGAVIALLGKYVAQSKH
jgi:hypothetical protein